MPGSDREKAGRLFCVGLPGEDLTTETREFLDEIRPSALCLFARNLKNAARVRALTDGIRDCLGYEPIICLDQEGGTVDRLKRILGPTPSANLVAAGGDPGKAEEIGRLTAEAARILGFNMDFAPVVDVLTENRTDLGNGLYSRVYGRGADEVKRFARAFLDGLQDGGCAGCLKHFPGIGSTTVDSHEELPSSVIDDDELGTVDLEPFRSLLDGMSPGAVMTGHVVFPSCGFQETDLQGAALPASLSRSVVTGILRDRLGFVGVAMTDDLEMGAIKKNWLLPKASQMALEAGNDLLLICNDADAVRDSLAAITEAVVNGDISSTQIDVSLEHIDNTRRHLKPPLEFDETRLKEISGSILEMSKELAGKVPLNNQSEES